MVTVFGNRPVSEQRADLLLRVQATAKVLLDRVGSGGLAVFTQTAVRVTAAICGVVLMTLAGSACTSRSGSGGTNVGVGSEDQPRLGQLSGGLFEWASEVCASGQATRERPIGQGSIGGGMCSAMRGDKSPTLLYQQFDSEDSMLRILDSVNPSYYAAGESDGVVTAFFVMRGPFGAQQVDTLEGFGFVIRPWSGAPFIPWPEGQPENPATASVTLSPGLPPTSQASTVVSGGDLRWRFASPTGNIACDLNGSTMPPEATCEVREHTYQPQVKASCDPGWANRFTLRQGQAVEVNCYSGTDFHSALPVQDYGRPLTVGSLACVLDEDTGVTCKDSTTGHYFQAARQAYEWR